MNQRPVVISGASSGIGAEIARVFSRGGYKLILLSRNLDAINALRLPNCHAYSLDVTDFGSFQKIIYELEQKFGGVNCLISSAGTLLRGDFDEIDPKKERAMVDVNLMGVINGIHAVLPGMKKRREGTIINISSLADRSPRPQFAGYAASKAAVKSLSESLRVGYASYGIRVCNLAPGPVETPMIALAKLSPTISPLDIANAALWMYEQPRQVCVRDLVIAPTLYEN